MLLINPKAVVNILKNILGSWVTVFVDRPLGSRHPSYPQLVYPINYGYIEGLIAGDGKEQDAYILGVDQPLSRFFGRVIAIIHRFNDVEDKLVVAPDGAVFTKEQIIELTAFQERYFDIEVEI